MDKAIYEDAIRRFINDESVDFSEVYCIGDKTTIIRCLDKYAQKHPEEEATVFNIKNRLDELMKSKLTHENFIKVLYSLEQDNKTTKKYVGQALSYLTVSREDAINILQKHHLTEKQFRSFMKKLKNAFPNQVDEHEYLERLYQDYLKEFGITNEEKSNKYMHTTLKSIEPERLETLRDVYNSGVCLEEYCAKEGKSISKTRTLINTLNKENAKSYNFLLEGINNRSTDSFYTSIRFIAYELFKLETLDMFDYYTYTKLNIGDFFMALDHAVVDKTFVQKLIIRIKEANAKIRKIEVSKNMELDTKTIIGGREITREEKEKVFNFIEENQYPIQLYNFILQKYLKNEIQLDNQYVKK